jgi:palmitoyltransferase
MESANHLNNRKSEKSENENGIEDSPNELIEKYCTYCYIDIPIRGKHCKICNSCISTFDHHCNWVGNCIGENNKRIFIIFLLFHSLQSLMILILVKKINLYYYKENK